MEGPQEFLRELEQRVAPVEDEICEVYWKFANTGDEALQSRLVELELEIHKIFSNAQDFQRIKDWRAGGQHDAETSRILELLYQAYVTKQEPEDLARRKAELDAEIAGRYANFRGEVNGYKLTNNDIKQTLKESTVSALRAAVWESSKQIGPVVAPLVLELVKLRNEGAQLAGYRDYYAMALENQEIDETELFELLDSLEQKTLEPFGNLKAQLDLRLAKRFNLAGPEELRPWHYEDPFFQDAPSISDFDLDPHFKGKNLEELTLETFDRVGLDIRPTLAQSDLYEREGKDQHAFCLQIGRHPERVHVLCNNRDNESWASTMLHEFGHAVYDQYLLPQQTYFLRGVAHTNSTEAIAMLFGRLTHNAAWLSDIAGVDPRAANEAESTARRQLSWQMIVFTRWMMVMTHFERALYADPAQDLNKLWWDLVERYQLLTRPEGRDMPDWATKTHIAQAPVYYHNYMIGEMTASQLQHHIETGLGNLPLIRQAQTGPWLRAGLFEQGSIRPWNEALQHLTGEKLNPQYFVNEFVGMLSAAGQ